MWRKHVIGVTDDFYTIRIATSLQARRKVTGKGRSDT
jgi:hypothetical protein